MSTRRIVQIGVGALAAAALLAGCANTGDSGGAQPTEHTTPAAAAASATTPAPGEAHDMADVMFNQHMIPHHQQAIEMSDVLLAKQGIDPRVVELANQIKAAQGPEIDQMRNRLNEWGMPAMSGGQGDEGDTTGHGGMPGMAGGMPGMGMMSDEDMSALRSAEGVDAAKLFLSQMIQHHEGAIDMAQDEVEDGRDPQTIALAQSIITSQQREIDTMRSILATL